MAVVAIPHNPPWVVARWAFREVLERLEVSLELEQDKYLVRQAIALDGLIFDLLEEETASRLARRLAIVADELRSDVLERGSEDPRDPEFAEYLSELGMRLHDIFE
jgi:hypothetical protein